MIKAAIVGFGNVGRFTFDAIMKAPDMELKFVVSSKDLDIPVPTVKSVDELKDIDVAILCLPSRKVPEVAEKLLSRGISTDDSYDIHSNIAEVRLRLDKIAKANGAKAIISAGWDPGSDSVVRALMLAMIPRGITYTNFGPGMSMGHTVAVKAIDGVKDALSMTIPAGSGVHRRMVYVELKDGADFETVAKAIKADDYFVHDETHVIEVDSVEALKDMGHGVNIFRKGVSGSTDNQRVEFNMSINNPALTAQIMVSSARAVLKQQPGCYTMIQIPPIDYLCGDTDELIRALV